MRQSCSLAVFLALLTLVAAQGEPDKQPSRQKVPEPAMKPPMAPAGAAFTVAVLNFDNLGQGDPAWDWLGKGLADLTIGDLSSQDLRVVSREQMQEMIHELQLKERLQQENGRPVTALQPRRRDPQTLARVLKVSRCVHGTFSVAGGKAQLHASILDADSNRQLHAVTASGPAEDVLKLQKKLSAELADVLKGNQPGTIDPAKIPRWTESLAASQLVYQGIDLFDKGDYLDAWSLFRRALRQDPRYADALYWSGRMMYYVQEYHQAQIDLKEFCIRHAKHQRVGDAVMEIINAAQLTASASAEVLEVLRFAAQLAPKAEVHNQFGAGKSSTVALYAAGLAAQIYLAQQQGREAFAFFTEQLKTISPERPLYWLGWYDLFKLKVQHLQNTGELLTMPPEPSFVELRKRYQHNPAMLARIMAGLQGRRLHSLQPAHIDFPPFGEVSVEGDVPQRQQFVRLSPEKPSVTLDFSADPLTPITLFTRPQLSQDVPSMSWAMLARTFTRHVSAPPGFFLTAVQMEVTYRNDPARKFVVFVQNPKNVLAYFHLDDKGRWQQQVELPRGTRSMPVQLFIFPLPAREKETSPAAILSWKMTGKFEPIQTSPGTVIFAGTNDLFFRVSQRGKELGKATDKPLRIDNLAPGSHTFEYSPLLYGGPSAKAEVTVTLAANEIAEIALSAKVDPRRGQGNYIPSRIRSIGTPYEAFRQGPNLGDATGKRRDDLSFLEDRHGRWIVLWNQRRDLYMATSSDRGRTWSPTVKLPPPVNSAHEERSPVMMQDAEGRYVLTFSSDRNLARAHAVYACWSDDLVNFSAPVMVAPDPGQPARVLQRDDGTYLAYLLLIDKRVGPWQGLGLPHFLVAVSTSSDLVHWSKPKEIIGAASKVCCFDVAHTKGAIVSLSAQAAMLGVQPPAVKFRTSLDGIAFSAPTSTSITSPAMRVSFRRLGNDLLVVSPLPFLGCHIWRHEGDAAFGKVRVVDQQPYVDGFDSSNGVSVPGDKEMYCFSLPYPHNWATFVPVIPSMATTLYQVDRLLPSDPQWKLPPTDLQARILRRSKAP